MSKIIPFERSFASHPKSQYWNYERNIGKPSDYALNSHKKCWFDCNKCGHCFDSILKNINRENAWCTYCHHLKLCNNDTCTTCFENSFASHPKSQFWSNKNILQPRQIFKNTKSKYWFNCLCGHAFEIIIHNISFGDKWCSYCSIPCQKLCKDDTCTSCFEKSFASIENSKYLTNKNINPRDIIKGSEKIYTFYCNKCNNDFDMRINCVKRSNWCSFCIHKTESKFYEETIPIYPSIARQFKASWCKNNKSKFKLPYDFVIENKNIIIELDGLGHFVQVSNWPAPKITHARDLYKMKCANENGYSIIRILQEDVWKNKFDWLQEVIKMIEKITIDNIVQNVYICKNNEYNNFESELFIA